MVSVEKCNSTTVNFFYLKKSHLNSRWRPKIPHIQQSKTQQVQKTKQKEKWQEQKKYKTQRAQQKLKKNKCQNPKSVKNQVSSNY